MKQGKIEKNGLSQNFASLQVFKNLLYWSLFSLEAFYLPLNMTENSLKSEPYLLVATQV